MGKISADASQSPSITPVPSLGLVESVLPPAESQPAGIQQQSINSAEIFLGGIFFAVFLFSSYPTISHKYQHLRNISMKEMHNLGYAFLNLPGNPALVVKYVTQGQLT